MRFQKFVPSLMLVGLLTGTALAQEAALPFSLSRTVNLPVVGLASSETAQVNVVNLAPSAQPVNNGGTAPSGGNTASCTGSITVLRHQRQQPSHPLPPSPSARARFFRPPCPIRNSGQQHQHQRPHRHSRHGNHHRDSQSIQSLLVGLQHGNLRHRDGRHSCPRRRGYLAASRFGPRFAVFAALTASRSQRWASGFKHLSPISPS